LAETGQHNLWLAPARRNGIVIPRSGNGIDATVGCNVERDEFLRDVVRPAPPFSSKSLEDDRDERRLSWTKHPTQVLGLDSHVEQIEVRVLKRNCVA
jgi:hypothetical protein